MSIVVKRNCPKLVKKYKIIQIHNYERSQAIPIDILQTILGGFVASIVWFIVGVALYMDPFVAKIYKNAETPPGLKKSSEK